jgi:hypothetical protein
MKRLLCAIPLGAASAGLALAAPAATTQPDPGDAITVYSAGLEKILSSPKDAALAKMLGGVDEALLALAAHQGGLPVPPEAVHFLFDLLTGPLFLRAGLLDPAVADVAPEAPFYVQLDCFAPTAADARSRADRIAGMLEEMGGMELAPAPGEPSLRVADADGMRLSLRSGPHQGRFAATVALNQDAAAPRDPGRCDMPEGVEPVLALTFDARRAQPALEQLLAMGGADAEGARQQLEMAGLAGPNAVAFSSALGHGADRAFLTMRYANYARLVREIGGNLGSRLDREALRRVPADATFAQVSAFDMASYPDMIENTLAGAAAEGVPDVLESIRQATGVDVKSDLFAHLGDSFGAYTSPENGGGLTSMVVFVEVRNPDALQRTIAGLTERMNQEAASMADGRVRVAAERVDGLSVTTVTFPGLPVPLQPALTIDGGCLYAAGNIESLLSAVRHGRQPGGGLLDHPRLKGRGAELERAMQITLIDTPALLQDGYGLLSMAANALGNATRVPGSTDQGVMRPLPPYRELLKDARPIVHMAFVEGDDLVAVADMDRSMLVNAGGIAGVMGGLTGAIALGSIGAGVMLPSLSDARSSAREVKVASQLRQVAMAWHIYAADHEGAAPPDLATLVREGMLEEGLLESPMGPAPEPPDIWLDQSGRRMEDVERPDRTVLCYDRAMYAAGDTVAVGFYDGHVEILSRIDLVALLTEPQHEGIDFHLP